MEEKIYFNDRETVACCQLNRVFGSNPKLGQGLIAAAGGEASAVFNMSYREIRQLLGVQAPPGLGAAGLEQAAKELENLADKGCWFIGITNNCYPSLLADCEDAPIGLYVRSKSSPEEIFKDRPYYAVVGTRDISHYGIEWCQKLTSAICSSKKMPCIVSGLALGTDIIAHKTALERGCPTIAVMATGIDSVYPRMHAFEADRIAESPGSALVTDYPPGTAPVAQNFLRRNRIIAGLSLATILIESRVKGGGMSTANMAFSYNREIYALPGKADDLRSGGCNKLIADKRAELVFTPEDLLEKLGLYYGKRARKLREMPLQLPEGVFSPEEIADAEAVLELIRRNRGISKSDLCLPSGMDIAKVSGIVSLLESEGLVFVDLLGNCSAVNTFH